MEQPLKENRYAVFFVHRDQTLMLNYERNETNPRITHELTLAVDQFGAVTESASITYPRQTTPHDSEQEKLWVSYTVTNVINKYTDPYWRRHHCPRGSTRNLLLYLYLQSTRKHDHHAPYFPVKLELCRAVTVD